MKTLRVTWKLYLITLVTLLLMVLLFTGVALGNNSLKFKIQDTTTLITSHDKNSVADHYANSSFTLYIFATESNGKQLSNPVINTPVTLTFSGPDNSIKPIIVDIVNNHGEAQVPSSATPGKWIVDVVAEVGKLKYKCEFNIVSSPTLSIVPNMPTISIRDSLQFGAIYSDGPESNPIDVTNLAEWSSDSPIASIGNKTGLATAGLLPGHSQITAKYKELSATTILNVVLPTITIEPSDATMSVGSEYQLTPVYSEGYNPTVTWSSSNRDLAPVDESGKVSGIGVGVFTITATDLNTGLSGAAVITVTPAHSSVFVVEPNDAVILKDSTQQFVAYFIISPSIKIPILNLFLEWSSADSNIATVNKAGSALGHSGGMTTIQASFDLPFLHYTSLVQLEVIVPDRIELTQDKTTIFVDEHTQFHATLVYNINQTRDITSDSVITWSSDAGAVAVSNQGLCTGISAGTSNITAAAYGVRATKPLKVVQPTLTINPDTATIRVGSDYQFELAYSPGYSSTKVMWSTSNPLLATVDSTGKVSGIGVGTVTITATDNDTKVSGTATVNVNLPTIAIVPRDVMISVGSSFSFGLEYSAGYSPTTITWLSSNDDLATVNSSGKVSGRGAGAVTITATDPVTEVSGTAIVKVNLSTITILPGEATIPAGSNHQFTLAYSPGYSPTPVIWSTSNPLLATVDSTGKVSGIGIGIGTVTITATDPATGVRGAALITITAPVTPPILPPGWGPNWKMEGPYN